MDTAEIYQFPDASSEDQTFEEFWQDCQETHQQISYQRARQLFHMSPEEYFKRSGWVYVLINPYMRPDVFKIGLTTSRIESRMRQLYTTGVPGHFQCEHADWVSDCHHAEEFLHEYLAGHRISDSREFFKVDLHVILGAFLTYCATGDPTPDHMVGQKVSREKTALNSEMIQGEPVFSPSWMEVPF